MGGPLSVVKVFTPIWTSQVHSLLLESSANFVSYSSYWCLVGNGWAWGLLGWLLIVIMDHSRKFPAFSTSSHMDPILPRRKRAVRPDSPGISRFPNEGRMSVDHLIENDPQRPGWRSALAALAAPSWLGTSAKYMVMDSPSRFLSQS